MHPFTYTTARTVDEAIEMVGEKGRYLAGGIDLLAEMKDYLLTPSPEILVNVKRVQRPSNVVTGIAPKTSAATGSVPFLNRISFIDSSAAAVDAKVSGASAFPGKAAPAEHFRIDANVTIAEIAASADLKKTFPGLTHAAGEVGSTQIRNVATIAGNLLQHSRCWYYRHTDVTCQKKGGDKCLARDGENRYHALFTGGSCVTVIASNMATMLTALDAAVTVRRGRATATLSMPELYAEAWKEAAAHHSLDSQDFLTGVNIPTTRKRCAYRQQSEKKEFDWALVSCAAAGNVTNGVITDARVVLGCVAPVPYMSVDVNNFLQGKPLNEETATKAADMLLKDAKPLSQNGYKVPLAHTLVRRALLALNETAG
ncbi:MAG TPA: FAD binding domain-containing protein [Candidatus Methylacidiphilales bacterium]|nr:FAD binding domain-containing protein [Candidatus Methylacidiphilales bacterium]